MVLKEFYHLLISGSLTEHFIKSFMRVMIGLTSGSIAGIFVGVIMGWKDLAHKAFSPIISFLYPIPALGWLPLLMLWIGINELLPIAIIFICSFFPVVYNTTTGIKNVDRQYILAAETLGASNIKILLKVVIPLALPNILTGLKLEAGMAWRVLVAAEMVAIPTRIGALLMQAESLVRVDIIMVCLICYRLCVLSLKRFLPLQKDIQ